MLLIAAEEMNFTRAPDRLGLYLGVNIATLPNQHRIELAREVIHCCFSKELLARTPGSAS